MDTNENQIFNAIIIAILVIGSIISFFIFSVINHQKKVLQLERENARAEIAALEKDRARIADDIHDDLSPMLVSVKMIINSFDLSNFQDCKELEAVNDTLNEMAKRMRAISFDLMPYALKSKGLHTALNEFVNTINRENNLQIKLWFQNEIDIADEQKTIHIYRIIKEIIHNTLKHAKATELTTILKTDKNILHIATEDNGIGFNYKQTFAENHGLGLRSLQNRINILGGQFKIESNKNKGTSFLIQIPLINE